MRIAVTTPTGQIGSSTVECLLELGGDVRVVLLGRRPEKLRSFVRRGAEMAIGSQDDTEYLVNATQGVDALFWVTPPGYGSDDLRGFQNRLANAAAVAILQNKIPRVVNLSSVGANLHSGAGPISGLHDVEQTLNAAAPNITHLRPGFFFENLLWQLESICQRNRISLPIDGARRYPMLATRDIARVAASRLASRGWSGHFISELHGPADLSFNEVAEILTQTLRRDIDYAQSTPEEARQMMLENALSENAADMLLEMYQAVSSGHLRPIQPRSQQTTTPTTLAEFTRDVLEPMIEEAVSR